MITFNQLQNKSSELYPAILLERFSNYYHRKLIRRIIFWLMFISLLAVLLGLYIPEFLSDYLWFFDVFKHQIRSLFFVLFSVWLIFHLARMFYFSHYFKDAEVDFEVAVLAMDSDYRDLTKGFLNSQIGRYALMRLGLGSDQIAEFLKTRQTKVNANDFDLDINSTERKYLNLRDYAEVLWNLDKEFAYFLSQHRIDRETFIGALEWVDSIEWRVRKADRWWDRSNLTRIQCIGRNWSFGKIYYLEKYGQSIMSNQTYYDLGDRWKIFQPDAEKIENILVKRREANVSLVVPTTSIGLQIVATLGKMIFHGKIHFLLEDKRIFILDTVALIESNNDPVQFERLFRNILFQADKAGNVILVIPNLPAFQERSQQVGVDVLNLLADFLKSAQMQIIAICDNQNFHQIIEPNSNLMKYFEKVLVEDINKQSAIKILQREANRLEYYENVFFTFQSLKAIADGAERYFVGATYSDKIIDLLDEIIVDVKRQGRKIITIDDSNVVIARKTGVPQGQISVEEKDILKRLEQILHQRIIGQNLAIDAIADAMRRARSGIADSKRPMGSFLFFGPTGVGKTETVKALNEIFFESESKIIRLDMSEYNGFDAIEKLIGSYTNKTSGILSNQIKDQQFGVLLLDEFEKTSDKVKDLFLQILDEGQFSDAQGHEINCRNLIIIATSNAGSDLIYQATMANKDLALLKDQVIDQIISDGIFKPELLNRFDGVILFHALNKDHLKQVAKLMINKLNQRILINGLKIQVNDEILNYLVEIGSNPKFGAREMNRKIKDEIESLIADKIIADEIKSGDSIEFKLNESDKLDLFVKNSLN